MLDKKDGTYFSCGKVRDFDKKERFLVITFSLKDTHTDKGYASAQVISDQRLRCDEYKLSSIFKSCKISLKTNLAMI